MKNKIIFFIFLILSPLFLSPTLVLCFDPHQTANAILVIVLTQIVCILFHTMVYYELKELMYKLNQERKLKDIFDHSITIQKLPENEYYSYLYRLEKLHAFTSAKYNIYSISYNNKLYMIQFEQSGLLSLSHILNGTADIAIMDDFTEEKEAAIQKQKDKMAEQQQLKEQTEKMIKSIHA